MLSSIKQAASISDQIFEQLLPLIRPRVPEIAIAKQIWRLAKAHGCTKLAFDTLVASGPRSAKPHAKPTMRKLKTGDLVFIDFGVKVNGYCSDCTRTFILGEPSEQQQKVFNIVLKAQQEAIQAVKAGVKVADIDLIARDFIKEQGYEKCFPHSTGHGVRQHVHVKPRVHFKTKGVLKAGEIITIEPAIYIKDFGGVRIEDMVLVTETGYEVLTHFPKKLCDPHSAKDKQNT